MKAGPELALTIATRPSSLARWQAGHVAQAITEAFPSVEVTVKVISTRGDRVLDQALPLIGGKGLFTRELELALHDRRVDLAVHSLKDLPIEDPVGLKLAAIMKREDARDVLVSREGLSFTALPEGSVVGTSSPRRTAQIRAMRPDLKVDPIRGNVETRVEKVMDGRYDAAVLAAAGLIRLGMQNVVHDWFSLEQILPAPGQGALAVQCREDDHKILELLRAIGSEPTRLEVSAERAFLASLGGGCSLPVGAHAAMSGDLIHLQGVIAWEDGRDLLRDGVTGPHPIDLGRNLAEQLLGRGGRQVLNLGS